MEIANVFKKWSGSKVNKIEDFFVHKMILFT